MAFLSRLSAQIAPGTNHIRIDIYFENHGFTSLLNRLRSRRRVYKNLSKRVLQEHSLTFEINQRLISNILKREPKKQRIIQLSKNNSFDLSLVCFSNSIHTL